MHIHNNISLKPFNTFAIDCQCQKLIEIDNNEDFEQLFLQKVFNDKFFILGGGSNVLFINDFEGTILHLKTKGIEIINETDEDVYVRAAGGEIWDDFVDFCVKNCFYGVENLAGIPGLVGSCPVQNIGAYGAEVKDVIYQVEGFHLPDGKTFVLYNEECQFAYRDSIFKNELKGQCLISHVVFKLSKNANYQLNYKQLADELEHSGKELSLPLIAETVVKIRNSKLPDITKIGCAGSFFKNPVISHAEFEQLSSKFKDIVHHPTAEGEKLAAGQLIELCGWKQRRIGDVSVYPNQALVIVNWGNAKGCEVLDYSRQIIDSVKEKFGVTIEAEVRIVG